MMKYLLIIVGLAVLILVFSGCRQYRELQALSECDYRIHSVRDTKLAGVAVQGKDGIDQLSILNVGKITAALASGELPMDFTLNVEVKNPNSKMAAVNKMEWIAFAEDQEIANGILTERYEVPPGGTTIIPLSISTDLMRALKGESRDAIIKLAFNIAGKGNEPSNITLKVKPSLRVGKKMISSPAFITINTEYSGK